MQHGEPVRVLHVDVGALLHQQLGAPQVALEGGEVQRREVVLQRLPVQPRLQLLLPDVLVLRPVQQQLHLAPRPLQGRVVQKRHPLPLVHVAPHLPPLQGPQELLELVVSRVLKNPLHFFPV